MIFALLAGIGVILMNARTRLGSFSLAEFAVSAGFPDLVQTPRGAAAREVKRGIRDILNPLRNRIDTPITITSGYRGPELNRAVGGSTTSDHANGRAADIIAPGFSNDELQRIVWDMYWAGELPGLDQSITYSHKGHLHLGWGTKARGMFLQAFRQPDGSTGYHDWTP